MTFQLPHLSFSKNPSKSSSPASEFPNPDCPWCPPGVFGNPSNDGGGSSGNPNNNNDHSSSSKSSTSETGTATITKAGYGMDIGGAYPTTYDAMSDLQALASSQSSKWNSMFSQGGSGNDGSGSTTTKTTTTKTTKPTPIPTAADGTTDETPSENGDWCLIYAWAVHSVGGGGPGQAPLYQIETGIETFGADSKLVFDAKGIDLTGMKEQDNVIDQDDWKGLGDVTVRTAYDAIGSVFTSCEFNYGGTWYDGTIKNDIDSNYVSEMNSDCTIYLSC